MLFDLRGRGRRRSIQVIYLTLAILMGGGLVLFGIGGATNGGLVDAISGGGGGSNDNVFQERVDTAVEKVQANPQDAAALAELARARAQFAQDQETEQEAIAELNLSARAWQRYLATEPNPVDESTARQMVNVYALLQKPEDAVVAQEYVIDASGEDVTAQQFAQLFQYALQAGQDRKADLAYDRAIELSPEGTTRDSLKAQLDSVRSQLENPAGTTTTPDAGTATTPDTGTSTTP